MEINSKYDFFILINLKMNIINKITKIKNNIINRFLNLNRLIIENWVTYTYIKCLYFMFPLPILLGILGLNKIITITLLIFYILIAIFLFLIEIIYGKIIINYPYKLVKSDKIKSKIEKYLYTYLFLIIIIFIYYINTYLDNNNSQIFFNYIFIPAYTILFGLGTTGIVLSIPRITYKYYTFSPIVLSRARLQLVFDMLNTDYNKQNNKQIIDLFREAIKIYNGHIRRNYNFEMSEPKKFYNYLILLSYLGNKNLLENFKDGLIKIINLLENDDNPLTIIKILKKMISDKTSLKDIFNEINYEPKKIRKWFSTHQNSIKLVVSIISLIITILISLTPLINK